jgi:hypothetical protein
MITTEMFRGHYARQGQHTLKVIIIDDMRAFFPLLLGQNPTPENHAKLLFIIGIPSGLRLAYHNIQI